MRIPVLVIATLLSAGASAETSPRAAIEQAYHKVAESLRLRYVDGLLSVRSPNFEVYNDRGARADLTDEEARYHKLLNSAETVKETYEISSLKMRTPQLAECLVHQVLTVRTYDPTTKAFVKTVLDSRSKDSWTATPTGWKETRSEVIMQTLKQDRETTR